MKNRDLPLHQWLTLEMCLFKRYSDVGNNMGALKLKKMKTPEHSHTRIGYFPVLSLQSLLCESAHRRTDGKQTDGTNSITSTADVGGKKLLPVKLFFPCPINHNIKQFFSVL